MADQTVPNGRIPEEARAVYEQLKRELTPEVLKEIEQEIQRMSSGEAVRYLAEDVLKEIEAQSPQTQSDKR